MGRRGGSTPFARTRWQCLGHEPGARLSGEPWVAQNSALYPHLDAVRYGDADPLRRTSEQSEGG